MKGPTATTPTASPRHCAAPLYLGPDELLVAAKLGFDATDRADDITATIDRAESAVRHAVPTARVIYLEPDIYRADYVPAERPAAPDTSGGH